MPNNVAFYTTGDTHPCVPDNLFQTISRQTDATVSGLYRRFAANHARRPFHADDINTALGHMRSLQAGSVRNFYFVGHGSNGIYGFRVTPETHGDVHINTMGETLGWVGNVISPLHRDFINEIVRAADRSQQVTVNFFSCLTANGNLLQEISNALRAAGITHVVSGTRHYWDLVGQAVLRGTRWSIRYREVGRLEVNLRQ